MATSPVWLMFLVTFLGEKTHALYGNRWPRVNPYYVALLRSLQVAC